MRIAAVLTVSVFAAAALSQNVTPASVYNAMTNSLGVATGMPLPVTTQPVAVTAQPVKVTSQPVAASLPANVSTLVVLPSVSSTSAVLFHTGSGSSGTNGTFTAGTPVTSPGSASTSAGASSSGSSTTSSSSGSTTSKASEAGMLEPMLGLGLAGFLFAAFL